MPDAWIFPARCERVVDGDTLDLLIDQGMRVYRRERVRLLGVDAPEVRGSTAQAGADALAWVRSWLAAAGGEWPLTVRTTKADSFGRYLARIWRGDGAELNADLAAHLARATT